MSDAATREDGGIGEASKAPRQELTPLVFEFKYKFFAFKLDDARECEPRRVADYLTAKSVENWAPRQVSETIQDGWLHVTALLMRAKPRKIIPVLDGGAEHV